MIDKNSKVLRKIALITNDDADLELAKEIDKTNQIIPDLVAEEVKKVPLQKGDPGDDGKDYILTESDKKEIATRIEVPIVEKIIERTEVVKEQPIVTEKTIKIIQEVPNKDTPDEIAIKLNELTEKVSYKVLKDTPVQLTIDEVLKALKNPKGKYRLELRDIKGAKLDMSDQRWHGGGLSNITGLITAGTNVTITGSGTTSDPYVINASGGVLSDEKVKYDAADPTAGYIVDKFIAGTGITLSEGTGANENKLVITNSQPAPTQTGSMVFIIGDGINTISAGTIAYLPQMPYSGTITGWYLTETTSPTPITGSIVLDVWKDTTGNYPPTVLDTIAGSEKPTLSSQTTSTDTNLTTWTTAFNAGDCFGVKVDSVSGCRKVLLTIKFNKS